MANLPDQIKKVLKFKVADPDGKDPGGLQTLVNAMIEWSNGKKGKKSLLDPSIRKEYDELSGGKSSQDLVSERDGKQKAADALLDNKSKLDEQNLTQKSRRQERSEQNASILGASFHNPYTFLPFISKGDYKKEVSLDKMTSRSPSELFTGLLRFNVKTESPMMGAERNPTTNKFEGTLMPSGLDQIVPASSIRGVLRNLCEIVTGSSVSHVAKNIWLRGENNEMFQHAEGSNIGQSAFVVEVIKAGGEGKKGLLQLGKTESIVGKTFIKGSRPDDPYKRYRRDPETQISQNKSSNQRLKLSGTPLQGKFVDCGDGTMRCTHKEGVFEAIPGKTLEVGADKWDELKGLNYGSQLEDRKGAMIKKGDLLWLILKNENAKNDLDGTQIEENQILSLSWTRWSRSGKSMELSLPEHAQPCANRRLSNGDNKYSLKGYDIVTNMFGMVSTLGGSSEAWAGRVRPDNLVFEDVRLSQSIPLAPLAKPHPSCVPFYKENSNSDQLTAKNPLKGYKVYRNSKETKISEKGPWRYDVQPVYNSIEDKKTAQQADTVIKNRPLLDSGNEGYCSLSLNALSPLELGLLLKLLTQTPLRIGGGKPLGLGRCKTEVISLFNRKGEVVSKESCDTYIKKFESSPLGQIVEKRYSAWKASQMPVSNMRYPRSGDQNKRGSNRGGHSWFNRFGSLKMSGNGVQSVRTTSTNVIGQMLPNFDENNPMEDFLYGYDLIVPINNKIDLKQLTYCDR